MTGEIRALIVDDEPAARALLLHMLDDEPGITVVGECGNGDEAVRWLAEKKADLVFLDIRMPGRDGFDVLRALDPADLPPVVFVTAHDEFAVRAFEAQAWDYLLKPFDVERLRQTLARVRTRLAAADAGSLADRLEDLLHEVAVRDRPIERLAVRKGRGRLTIRVADVDWIEADSNYVRLHLEGASYLARSSLSALAQKLDPYRFVRIHRSAIVNVDRIARLEPCGHGDQLLTLDGGRQLTLSRRYRHRLERVLESLA